MLRNHFYQTSRRQHFFKVGVPEYNPTSRCAWVKYTKLHGGTGTYYHPPPLLLRHILLTHSLATPEENIYTYIYIPNFTGARVLLLRHYLLPNFTAARVHITHRHFLLHHHQLTPGIGPSCSNIIILRLSTYIHAAFFTMKLKNELEQHRLYLAKLHGGKAR